jgi:hypothetical protein
MFSGSRGQKMAVHIRNDANIESLCHEDEHTRNKDSV